MQDDRLRCAGAALRRVPEDYRTFSARELVAEENGHHFYRGLHIGWAWGENERGTFLDFLSEHRMVGMQAERIYPDGTTESIETPASMHLVTGDPEQDTEIERKFFDRNNTVYKNLRQRGLLPEHGANVGSQVVNEFLLRGPEFVEVNEASVSLGG